METASCRTCSQVKPVSSFGRCSTRTGKLGGVRKTCRACRKVGIRARKVAAGLRADGKVRTPRVVTRLPEPFIPAHARRDAHLQQLRRLLVKLCTAKCAALDMRYVSVQYRAQYQADPAFREKEIARSWARKAASGILRTDGRNVRHIHEDGTLTASVVRELFASARVCPYCNRPMRSGQKSLDHVFPTSRGGLHSIANVVVCCRSCNCRKHARTPEEMGWANPLNATPGAKKHATGGIGSSSAQTACGNPHTEGCS